MSSLKELYQEVILDHYKSPRNFGSLDTANRKAEGHNPLCGDRVSVFLELEDGVVRNLSFEGAGCAISTASASLMTESVRGKSLEEISELFQVFHSVVTGHEEGDLDDLGKLAVFEGVRKYPVRVKCATLAWHALQKALEEGAGTTTTEETRQEE